MKEIKGLPRGRGLTMNKKGFAKKEGFRHEEKKVLISDKVLAMEQKCFVKS